MKTKFNFYTVIYQFNNSKFGFQNSITVESISPDMAKNTAMNEISGTYGSKMAKRFSIVSVSLKNNN